MKHATSPLVLALAAGAMAVVPAAGAQTIEDKWQFQAILYAYLPDVGGSTSFPERGGTSINVNFDKILDSLNFAFMGTLEARKGRWGLFTDLIYLDVSGDANNTRNVGVGGGALPIGVSSNVDLGIKGTAWTLAGTYRVTGDPTLSFDVLAGARLLDVKERLSYSFSADVGPIVGPGRSGVSDVDQSYWDFIVGAKGRYNFGDDRRWFLPYYADVGTGESDLTWQLFGGVGYTFSSWGSVLAGWRYLDYKFKSDSKIESLNFNGPLIGVAFNW